MADNICPLAARPKTAVNGDKRGRVRDTGRGWGAAGQQRQHRTDMLMLFVGRKLLLSGTKVQRLTLEDRFPRRNWGKKFLTQIFSDSVFRCYFSVTTRLLSNVKVDLDNFLPTFSFQVLLLDQIVSQTTNNTGQIVTLYIPLVCNGDVKMDRNGARLDQQSAFIVWEISCLMEDKMGSEPMWKPLVPLHCTVKC